MTPMTHSPSPFVWSLIALEFSIGKGTEGQLDPLCPLCPWMEEAYENIQGMSMASVDTGGQNLIVAHVENVCTSTRIHSEICIYRILHLQKNGQDDLIQLVLPIIN